MFIYIYIYISRFVVPATLTPLLLSGVSEIISFCTIIEIVSLGGLCQHNHPSLYYGKWCVLKYAMTG